MPAPRRMTREQRRSFLIDRAAALVQKAGAGALSFEALADAAGVAKSLPYAYFGSTDEILLELFDAVIGRLDGEVRAILREGGEFDELVRRALDVWLDAARDHGRLVGALLDGRSVPGLDRAIRRRDRASLELWRDFVAARFDLEDADAHVLSAMLTSTATTVVELWIRRKGARVELVESFVALASGAARSRAPASRSS